MTVVGFGKYKGKLLKDVPEDYLDYMIDLYKQKIKDYEIELKRRELQEENNLSMLERIIKTGYRNLSKDYHPDHGGSEVKMVELNAAYELIQKKIKK